MAGGETNLHGPSRVIPWLRAANSARFESGDRAAPENPKFASPAERKRRGSSGMHAGCLLGNYCRGVYLYSQRAFQLLLMETPPRRCDYSPRAAPARAALSRAVVFPREPRRAVRGAICIKRGEQTRAASLFARIPWETSRRAATGSVKRA